MPLLCTLRCTTQQTKLQQDITLLFSLFYCDHAWMSTCLHLPAANLFLVSCYGFPLLSPTHVSGTIFAYVSFRWSLWLLHNVSIKRPDPKNPSYPFMQSITPQYAYIRTGSLLFPSSNHVCPHFLQIWTRSLPARPKKKKMAWGSLAKFNRDLIFYCFGGDALAKAKEGDKERN